MSDPRPPLQINRQHNMFLHPVGSYAANVRVNGEAAGGATAKHRRDSSRLVIRMVGCSSGRTLRRRLVYCHVH